jgi:hypothetical protein
MLVKFRSLKGARPPLAELFKSTALAVLIVLSSIGCSAENRVGGGERETSGGIALTEAGVEGADEAECSSHTDCGQAQICESGVCLPNEPGGPCEIDLNCIDGEFCGAGSCVPESGSSEEEMGCGGEIYQATVIPPNVLIVLDRSGSMDAELGGDQGTKWEVAQAAIGQVVTEFGAHVQFGLSLYPGLDPACDEGAGCSPGDVFVDVGTGTAEQIIEVLSQVDTCTLGTPTAEALEGLKEYPGLEDLDRPNFILLVTDGKSTCDNPAPVVAALRTETPEIKTFVVGFGDGADPDELNGMAEAGGTALMGDPKYYQADDAQALVDAFSKIVGDVLSCTFVLDMVPPNHDELYVFINGESIPRDPVHVDGWDYNPKTNQISFFGPPCELLQSGQVMDLEFVFGCPEAP